MDFLIILYPSVIHASYTLSAPLKSVSQTRTYNNVNCINIIVLLSIVQPCLCSMDSVIAVDDRFICILFNHLNDYWQEDGRRIYFIALLNYNSTYNVLLNEAINLCHL